MQDSPFNPCNAILNLPASTGQPELPDEPVFFRDLNLDQIVESIIVGRDEYHLKALFYTRLTSVAEITYRQEIMRDLENRAVFECVKSFSAQMRAMRQHLATARDSRYKYQKWGHFLAGAALYCQAVHQFRDDLSASEISSRGLRAFRKYLDQYTKSDGFKTLSAEVQTLQSALASITCCVHIHEGRVMVSRYNSQVDYSEEIEKTFARFRQGSVKDYRATLSDSAGMNHIDAQVLDRVARLNPEIFGAVDSFCANNGDFPAAPIADFDRGIQFYIAWLEYAERFKRAGLKFCYPRVLDSSKNVSGRESFDMALADKLVATNTPVVCNDFCLNDGERIFVVSGPNQGGKTTFARMFGQLHYLASLGCPVPGSEANLFLYDQMFTHFERRESLESLRGKLQDDLIRIHDILGQATPKSIVILNEIFSSTSMHDGIYLGKKVIDHLSKFDLLCVCVTFIDELSRLNEKTVSLVAAVAPNDPTLRTFRVEKRPADGRAYALAIAEKHRVTYRWVKERIKP